MLTLEELESLEKHIKSTRNTGEKSSEIAFLPLKKYLTDRLIECIGSRDGGVRQAAVRISQEFTTMNLDHQKRVIFAMSNKL